jgi:indolepyruvate ferredoxin oxidoreductase
LAYIRANKLNYNAIEGKNDRFGLIASGKAYNDTRQALLDLGLNDDTCRQIGIRLHKVGVVWPLEAQLTREFATGLQEILVVEEKRQVIEYQLKEELYNWRDDVRPTVLGKFNEMEGGEWSTPSPSANTLLRANADLSPSIIAKAIAQRLKKLGVTADISARMEAQLAILEAKERSMQVQTIQQLTEAERQPWFCSGCPHNTSTKVPEGSRAMAGIGCHFMSIWMDRSTVGFTQMGGEGVPWVGQQPFTTDQHIFANLGDGTYFHSGLLAVRQSIAAGVNITYKILYNDAVAMTGGQPVGERPEGHSVVQIAQSMQAEGAVKIVVVTDEPEKYEGIKLVQGVTVHHRDELDTIQKQFREIKGTTVIIYDQTCATEKRRRRKRGTMVDVAKRVVINELVCEGCGDCSVQSNCLSVEPLETDFGRKRTINQSSCNKDYSCVKGFCPSFVTVEGGQLKKKSKATSATQNPFAMSALPEPAILSTPQAYGIVVNGVGGTGVITIGQLLGFAAHIEGKGIVTQDAGGLAQKGGATWSHVLIADHQDDIRTTRVGMAGADLIIGCDPIVSANKETTLRMRAGRTHVALNAHSTPTAAFVKNANWQNPSQSCLDSITQIVGTDGQSSGQIGGVSAFNADALATVMMGDSIYTNPIMLGYAWQKGWVPLQKASLMRAIELNAVAVDNNKTAFEWGCRAAHNWAEIEPLLKSNQSAVSVIDFKKRDSLEDIISKRVAFLTAYQNAAYASKYIEFVEKIRSKERALKGGVIVKALPLTEAVARNLFKLMAYKDEYEVARLHSDGTFEKKIAGMFEGDYKLNYHLAPPIIAKKNDKGELQKQQFGPWMLTSFKLLSKLKGLRGTAFDIFGRTAERQMERALIADYTRSMEQVLQRLSADNMGIALDIARIPDSIKGFGHVKEKNATAARLKWDALMKQFKLY